MNEILGFLKENLFGAFIIVGVPVLIRLIPNKKLSRFGEKVSINLEKGRYKIYKLSYKLGHLIEKIGKSKLKKAWEKVEGKTIEAFFNGFIVSERKMPWSLPLAIAYGVVDGCNQGEEGYQKKGPGIEEEGGDQGDLFREEED